jgi:hypothetical protein
MIVSSDYKYVRSSTWQGELSREQVFRRFPDKRSWWIDPSGQVFDAGQDHDVFVKEHPELFDHDEGDTTYYAVRKSWVRVSMWGPSFTINARNINQVQLDAAQGLYLREGTGKRVEFFQDGVIPTSFDREEFLSLKNVNQLKRMRQVKSSTSDWMKRKFPEKRSWWVSPFGVVQDAGYDHDRFVRENPRTFGGTTDPEIAINSGWLRVGYFGNEFVIHGSSLKPVQIEAAQNLYRSLGIQDEVYVVTPQKYGDIEGDEFLRMHSPADILRQLTNRTGRRESRLAALPKSRNFLLGVDLGTMSWPLQQAFDLLGLSAKKDELSANQVASAFQANDRKLQETLGRTSVELLRDLNAFVQFDNAYAQQRKPQTVL